MILHTMVGYRSGPKMRGLLEYCWSRQEVVTRQNVFCGPQFQAAQGTTQVLMSSPTLFNVEVDSVVRHWLSLIVEDESTVHGGLRTAVGRSFRVFYADDGLIRSRDLERIQGRLIVLIGRFRRV